jgi:hypothetical protein
LASLFTSLREHGEQDSRKGGNNSNHHEQLNQGETNQPDNAGRSKGNERLFR